MRKSTLGKILLSFVVVGVTLVACQKDDPATLIPPPVPDQSFTEEFDTVASAFKRGWLPINNSNPKGSGIWTQGGGPQPIFEPYSSKGSYAGFIAADYTSTGGTDDVISNWLVSPLITMQNGDKIVFYTRAQLLPNAFASGDSTDYGNNLELCVNLKNEGTNVGTAIDPTSGSFNIATDRGDFELLVTVNPPIGFDGVSWQYRWAHSLASQYEGLSFPSKWTRFEGTIGGLSAPKKGRFAFRYYTLDAGSNGNGSAIGIDQVSYISKK